MNKRVKDMWIKALESGEYIQGKDCLRKGSFVDKDYLEFCCLGVLCDLHAKETGNKWEGSSYFDAILELPYKVQEWAGLDYGDPVIDEKRMSTRNDIDRMTFPQLSEFIKERL